MRAPPELLKISPLGKSPVITDGDVTLAESGAIVGEPLLTKKTWKYTDLATPEYLIGKYGNGKGQPPETHVVDNLYCKHISISNQMA